MNENVSSNRQRSLRDRLFLVPVAVIAVRTGFANEQALHRWVAEPVPTVAETLEMTINWGRV